MSTPRVLTQARAKIAAAGLRLHLLPPSFDVDENADLDHLRAELGDPALAMQLPEPRRGCERRPRLGRVGLSAAISGHAGVSPRGSVNRQSPAVSAFNSERSTTS